MSDKCIVVSPSTKPVHSATLHPAVTLIHIFTVMSVQAHWSVRRGRWNWGREGSYSLSMMSTRKLEGEPAHYIDIAQAVHDLCLLRSDLTAIIFLSFRGTFGVVKRVVHRRTGEVFAAKFLPLRSSTRTRAFQERDLLSRLAHPRVACLLDFFCTRRTLVLITEMYPPC